MDSIFGLPISGVMVSLLIALGLCLLTVAWVAWRRPVIFKLGVRNIPRRRAQTTLIVVGLMLSTLIISAALGTGDTLDYSLTKDVYENYGNVDTLVVQSQQVDAPYIDRTTKIDESALGLVESALAGNEQRRRHHAAARRARPGPEPDEAAGRTESRPDRRRSGAPRPIRRAEDSRRLGDRPRRDPGGRCRSQRESGRQTRRRHRRHDRGPLPERAARVDRRRHRRGHLPQWVPPGTRGLPRVSRSGDAAGGAPGV